jgi:NADH-quinone oxidoreductase subunit A
VLGQYLPLLALLVLAAAFAAVSFVASGLLAPRKPTVAKQAPYECGIVPARDTPERFPVRFFLVAMIFIVFDIEIIFFYPYAVARGGLGLFGLGLILVFSFAVFESFVYLIGNGALEWGPSARRERVDRAVSTAFTSTSGIRRVGLEGRALESAEEVA